MAEVLADYLLQRGSVAHIPDCHQLACHQRKYVKYPALGQAPARTTSMPTRWTTPRRTAAGRCVSGAAQRRPHRVIADAGDPHHRHRCLNIPHERDYGSARATVNSSIAHSPRTNAPCSRRYASSSSTTTNTWQPQTLNQGAPLRSAPESITDSDKLQRLRVRRHN